MTTGNSQEGSGYHSVIGNFELPAFAYRYCLSVASCNLPLKCLS